MIPALARWNGDHAMTKDTTKEAAVAAEALLLDDWFDAIEDGVRARARGFIETMLEEELSEALSRPRYGRRKPGEDEAAPSVVGVRHGHRERTLTGTFGKTRIAVPRARLTGEDGKTREWRSGSLRAYQRRTRAADALIAGAYLAGTNTRRVRRALNAVFAGPVGKDVVSRVWRKTKGDWDAWNARSLAEQPIVRLILDGTVARVRLDRRATSISLLIALGVRADGQKMLLAIKSMGGEGEAACARCSTISSGVDCRRRSWSSSTARRVSKRRWRRCGPTWLSSAAPCTSIAISSPMRPSACTRKSRTTTAT
jgi:transposase-like protein